MAKQIKMRGVRRKEMDEEKLALAFLLLAKVIADESKTRSDQATELQAVSESDMAA